MTEEPKSQPWFQTLPGILTAVAAVLTAVTGLVVALKPADISQPSTQTTISPSPQASSSPTIDIPNAQPSPTQVTADIQEEGKPRGKKKKKD